LHEVVLSEYLPATNSKQVAPSAEILPLPQSEKALKASEEGGFKSLTGAAENCGGIGKGHSDLHGKETVGRPCCAPMASALCKLKQPRI
jgi:hypothetical protein